MQQQQQQPFWESLASTHHSPDHDQFRSQLFVDREDVQDAEEEGDEVDAEDNPSCFKAFIVRDEAEDHAGGEEDDGDDVENVPGVGEVAVQFGLDGRGVVCNNLQDKQDDGWTTIEDKVDKNNNAIFFQSQQVWIEKSSKSSETNQLSFNFLLYRFPYKLGCNIKTATVCVLSHIHKATMVTNQYPVRFTQTLGNTRKNRKLQD